MKTPRFSGSRLGTVVLTVALVVAALLFRRPLLAWFGLDAAPSSGSSAAPGRTPSGAEASAQIDHYTCPMHPSVKQKGPGKCPLCGMDLVAVSHAEAHEGVVFIDDRRRQLIGVRTEVVVERPVERSLRAVGKVTVDESVLTDVTLRVSGFVKKLSVNRIGQRVKAGQTMFSYFSPDLFGAEQDFLLATQASAPLGLAGAPSMRGQLLGRAARQRLHLLGLGEGQIDALEKRGSPSESVAFPAPATGFVIEKDIVEGAAVQAGMRLFRIAPLDRVWVEADVYEADLSQVRVGQRASVTLDYLPGRSFEGTIATILPLLDPATRTGRIRVELANEGLELRPGMFANVVLSGAAEPRLEVPASAVVYTGPRRLVFVDLGQGRFEPREVRIGAQANGRVEVLSGLHAGERVASSGVFLIAAEARISTAVGYWSGGADAGAAPDSVMPKAAPSSSASPSSGSPKAASPVAPSGSSPVVYSCPMHPEVESATPGACPKCGMPLEPRPRGAR